MSLHQSTKDYVFECKVGRDSAERLIRECQATDNLPKFVREVRTAALDQSGYGVAFLYALGLEALK